MAEKPFCGDKVPAGSAIIEVRLQELNQLFDSMDPSPFHAKDLDGNAEDYIVGSANELPARAPLALVVYVDKPAGCRTRSASWVTPSATAERSA